VKKYLFVIAWLLLSSIVLAEIPRQITIQGRLTGVNDVPVPSVSYLFNFTVYETLNPSVLVWSEQFNVIVTNGLFNTFLTPPSNVLFDKPYSLEVLVNGNKLSPRVNITSAGYAFYANVAGTVSEMDWVKLQNYPASCGATQAVRIIGDTLTCVDVLTPTSSFGGDAASDVSGIFSNLQIKSGAVTNPEIANNAVNTTQIIDLTITNADISSTAGIVWSKLSGYPTITAGNGLTGGGDLSASRTLDVGAGTGISVAADAVSLAYPSLSCTGQAIQSFNLGTGYVGCMAAGSGTVTSITAGTGLIGGTITTTGTISLNTTYTDITYVNEGQANSITTSMIVDNNVANAKISEMDWVKLQNYPASCGATQAVRIIGDTLTCVDVLTTTTGFSAAAASDAAISGTYNSLDMQLKAGVVGTTEINSAQVQRRVTGTCLGQVVVGVNADGTVTCEADDIGVGGGGLWGLNGNYVYNSTTAGVGIGTTSPDQKLDVVGQIVFGDADAEKAKLYRDTGWLHIQNLADTYDISIDGPLHVRTGGPSDTVDEVTVTSAGNVGIGTTTPSGKLTVTGTSGDARSVTIDNREIKFRGDGVAHFSIFGPDTGKSYLTIQNTGNNYLPGTAGTDLLTITSTGNVGIGTTGPLAKLTVESARQATVSTANAAAKIGGSDVYSYFGSLSGGSYATWIQSMRTSDDAVFPLALNPNGGNVGIGTTSPQGKLHVTGSAGGLGDVGMFEAEDASMNGLTLGYDTANNWAWLYARSRGCCARTINLNNALYAQYSGNVGIGTTGPGAKLEIQNTANQPALSIGDSTIDNGATYGMVNLARPADLTRAHLAFIRSGNYVWQMGYVQNTNTFGIFPWNLNSGGTPAIAFTTAGNVGIGTTSPTDKLDVRGVSDLRGIKLYYDTWENAGVGDGGAKIVNDNVNYKTLMIVGNNVNDGSTRRVSVWDRLEVNGNAAVTGNLDVGGKTKSSSAYLPHGFSVKMTAVTGPSYGADNQYHTVECPSGYALFGVSVYATGYLDGYLTAFCIDVSDFLDTSDTYWATDSGGTGDNTEHRSECGAAYVGTGVRAYATAYLDYYLNIKCTKLKPGFGGNLIPAYFHSNWANWGAADNVYHDVHCPTGSVAFNIRAYATTYLDSSLGLQCTNIIW